MNKTAHFEARSSQRSIRTSMVEATLALGETRQGKTTLNRNTIDRAVQMINHLERALIGNKETLTLGDLEQLLT